MTDKILQMKLLKEKYGVARLCKTDPVPEWVKESAFFSVTKTSDELSIVCVQDIIPEKIRCERGWRIFKIEGPLDFSLIGILASVSAILAQKGISIFAVSTYDTDYILVKDKDINKAIESLVNENYEVII